MKSIITLLFMALLTVACSVEPSEIPYDRADCSYCRMSITDQRYGAELVSSKGKAYYFDALECQINYRLEHPETEWAYSLTTPFTAPGTLISTDDALILRSPDWPSPMGMNLTTLPDQATAEEFVQTPADAVYTYEAVLDAWNQWQQP